MRTILSMRLSFVVFLGSNELIIVSMAVSPVELSVPIKVNGALFATVFELPLELEFPLELELPLELEWEGGG